MRGEKVPGLCEGEKIDMEPVKESSPWREQPQRYKSSQISPTVAGAAVLLINHLQHI